MPELNENIVYGRNAVNELLRSNAPVDKLIVRTGQWDDTLSGIVALARQRRIPVTQVEQSALARMCGKPNHQGVIAFCSEREYCTIDEILTGCEVPFVLVVDGVEDPQNLGALLRCADAAGVHGVIISKHGGTAVTPAVVKASAGAALSVPIARVPNISKSIEELKRANLWIYGAEGGGKSFREVDMSGPMALVVGSEGQGLSRLVREKCDFIVSIPMMGKVNSLNVSCAAAVLLYAREDSF